MYKYVYQRVGKYANISWDSRKPVYQGVLISEGSRLEGLAELPIPGRVGKELFLDRLCVGLLQKMICIKPSIL